MDEEKVRSGCLAVTTHYDTLGVYKYNTENMKGFLDFIREQGAIGLAVGFILGGAVSDLVKSIIDNLINPILGIVLNKVDGLEAATFGFFGATIKYGALISTLINFCVIAAVVYFGVKKLKLDKLDKSKD